MKKAYLVLISVLAVFVIACDSNSDSSSASSEPAVISTVWAKTFGGSTNDMGYSQAIDSSGNIYTTGTFNGTVDFGNGNVSGDGHINTFLTKHASDGTLARVTTIGSSSAVIGNSVAVDASGNLYIAGNFEGTIDFGNGNVITSNGGSDIFLVKFDSTGTFVWAKTYGGTSSDVGLSVAADTLGKVYITGYFRNTVDFGTGGITSEGNIDIFLLQCNASDGSVEWVKTFGKSSTDSGQAVTVDSDNNVYMTGYFLGSIDFGGGLLSSTGGLEPRTHVFLVKYTSAGTFEWVTVCKGSDTTQSLSITVDSGFNTYVCGHFLGSVSFDGTPIASNGGNDVFLVKYAQDGTLLWAKTFGGTSVDKGVSVDADSGGNVYMAVFFNGTFNLDGRSITSNGQSDMLVVKYLPNGTLVSAKTYGDTLSETARSVAVDTEGNACLTGYYQGTPDFGEGNVTNNGGHDVFLLKVK